MLNKSGKNCLHRLVHSQTSKTGSECYLRATCPHQLELVDKQTILDRLLLCIWMDGYILCRPFLFLLQQGTFLCLSILHCFLLNMSYSSFQLMKSLEKFSISHNVLNFNILVNYYCMFLLLLSLLNNFSEQHYL